MAVDGVAIVIATSSITVPAAVAGKVTSIITPLPSVVKPVAVATFPATVTKVRLFKSAGKSYCGPAFNVNVSVYSVPGLNKPVVFVTGGSQISAVVPVVAVAIAFTPAGPGTVSTLLAAVFAAPLVGDAAMDIAMGAMLSSNIVPTFVASNEYETDLALALPGTLVTDAAGTVAPLIVTSMVSSKTYVVPGVSVNVSV